MLCPAVNSHVSLCCWHFIVRRADFLFIFLVDPADFDLPNPAISMLWKQTKTKWKVRRFFLFCLKEFILKPGLKWHKKKCRVPASAVMPFGIQKGLNTSCEPNIWAMKSCCFLFLSETSGNKITRISAQVLMTLDLFFRSNFLFLSIFPQAWNCRSCCSLPQSFRFTFFFFFNFSLWTSKQEQSNLELPCCNPSATWAGHHRLTKGLIYPLCH